MKIAIIGAGWIGCHLAKTLRDKNKIVLYEKNKIFSGASFHNQNRLHLGYHYSRDYNTRILCKNTFNKFYNQYSFLIDEVKKNIYCIPLNESLLDFNTYLKIFDDFDTHKLIKINGLENIEGSILVEEKYIDPIKSKIFFENQLNDILEYREINNIEEIKYEYDLIINCTNNNFLPIKENIFYEKCISLLYEKINETEFDALTLVDGKLMSIYPYNTNQNLYSLTDVEFTPMADKPVEYIKENMEKKITKYYKNFLNNFKYHSYIKSIKYKIKSHSDTRVPIIQHNDNVISCFTGKIQGIYLIENYINNL